ncbi:phenylacetate-CoA oxygenase subunit PaaC [Streptomyces sp. P38-E01]|uniref:Phenylacetate-CoA oxygenase subunit PaaC n=1 Tax=Streptomyces tardus TaxID=2780544 RepID=A0A949JEC2_9ACTN|nr:1,2-phenylacetyl-CoA epoxidase subunit PaaC [Streptomyces tardus]MBU7597882.1 phenylacetate-CoA oxygenase subunit PaaC [Streptomyces tardus]
MSAYEQPPGGGTPGPEHRAALALGDDALVLAQRLGEWAGHAPVLEEDVALSNIALDLLGQARTLLSLAGDEDELAYLREEREFRNVQLVEQPNGDFADTIARQLYFSVHQELLYGQLAGGRGELAELAAKAVKETAYHRDHAEQWTLRLGDGTAESRRRMQSALDGLWRYTGELFQPVEGVPADWEALASGWRNVVGAVIEQATLAVPEGPQSSAWSAGTGRQGVHTEAFGRMLAEMQHLHRSHPGASW